MLSRLLYYLNLACYPNRKDFLSMGEGIGARYKRCKRWWQPHLEMTKSFVKTSLAGREEGSSIAILGAGRLLDVDVDWLLSSFNKIFLVDADPSAARYWRKVIRKARPNQHVEGMICDVTGVIDSWSTQLASLGSGRTFLDNLKRSDLFQCRLVDLPRCDYVVSLNLLSQISLYWRDRVTDCITAHGLPEDDDFESELHRVIDTHALRLEDYHLSVLQSAAQHGFLVISDVEFYYYHRDLAEWQVEIALDQQISQLLGAPSINNFKAQRRDCWLWHLAPQGVEAPDHGEIHRVEAVAYFKE